MKFFAGLIVGILLIALIFVVIVLSGIINMAASSPPGRFETKVGNTLFTNSLHKRATKMNNPYLGNRTAIQEGEHEYKEMCTVCHGINGVEPGVIGKGLNPPAPELDEESVQQRSDGELFWIIENGIRMTGMPAFGKTHPDETIEKIVAYVRTLPRLSASEKEELRVSEHQEGEETEEEH